MANFREAGRQMADALQRGTGVVGVRDTFDHTSGVCRSYEVPLAEGKYVYLEESRNYNEELIGYNLIFCLVDPTLPEALTPEQKERIEQPFKSIAGEGPTVWASISAPYTREDHPQLGKGQDWGKRCLWLDIKFKGMQRELRDVVPFIPAFKAASKAFVFPTV